MALIAWYKLDGDATDSSGNGYNGTPTNMSWVSGKIGQAGSFNGSGSYVNCSNNAIFNLKNTFTLSCWVNPSQQTTRYNGVISKTSGNTAGYELRTTNTDINSTIIQLRVMSGSDLALDATVSNNVWSLITAVFNNGNATIFVNGIATSFGTLATESAIVSNDLFIGKLSYTNLYYKGYIDDVRIYSHALSPKEIKELSKAKVLHYDFDDFQEPTTNLMPIDITTSFYTFENSCTSVATGEYYMGMPVYRVTFPSSTLSRFRKYFSYSSGQAFTGSIYYKFVSGNEANPQFFFRENSFGTTYATADFPYTTIWSRQNLTYTFSTSGTCMFLIYRTNGAAVTNIVMDFAMPQLEQKDHTTLFVNGSRTGLVKDISGYENNSTLTEATTPQWSANGILGLGNYYFNGTVNPFIQPPNSMMENVQDFTFSIWYKASSFSDRYLFSARLQATDNYFLVGVDASAIKIYLAANIYNFSITNNLNEWTLLTFTRSGTTLTTYKNGAQVNTQTCANTIFTIDGAIVIGQEQDTVGGFSESQAWHGYLDDFRFYNTALSTTDILELYQTKANLDNMGNLSTHKLISTWPKNAYEYKQLNPSATSGVYNIRPTGSSNYIEAYCDMTTTTHSGETGWTLVGSWDDAPEWTKTSITSSAPFLTTAKNCVSSNFGNEVIHAFRILVSNDITLTGSAAVADWYYYWSEGTTWKAVWAPDGRNYQYWVSPTPRCCLRPFDLSYNLKYNYINTFHKYNNLSDYGNSGATIFTDNRTGLIGTGNATLTGFCNFWRALTQPGNVFGAYGLSPSGAFGTGNDGSLGMVIQGAAYAYTGQDIESYASTKIGYDDNGIRAHAGTTATDATFNTLADNVKMWWFIL